MPFERVTAALRAKIENGDLLPGEQMPTLIKISEEYGISRTTAQKVIRALAAEGLVDIKPRWGVFVTGDRPK